MFALLTCGGVACAPLLGLDDLHEREKVASNDSGGDTDASDASEAPTCVSNKECMADAAGAPALCVTGKCVKVDPFLCGESVRPSKDLLERDDVIVTAAFMYGDNPLLTGPGFAYDLALKEIEEAKGILGRKPHRLAMLICKASEAERGLKHVVNDLKLPVIIAAFGSGILADSVLNDVVKAGTFVVNPSFTTDFLKYAETKNLVLSLLGTAEDVALAYRPVLTQLKIEKSLPADIKVAIIATDGSIDKPMANLLQFGQIIRTGTGGFDTSKALDMNGKTPEQDPDHFKRFDIRSGEFPDTPDPLRLATAKTDLIAFDPDVVIALTTYEINDFLQDVDKGIIANRPDGSPKKTYWILGPSNGGLTKDDGTPNELAKYLDFDAPNTDERRGRFLGIQFAGPLDRTEGDKYRTRLGRFGEAGAVADPDENFYDAIYWIAYGIASAGQNATVNGQAWADSVPTLIDENRPKIYAGDRTTIEGSFSQINELKGTNFVGALGPPDINKATRTWNSVGSTYCYPPRLEFGKMPTYEVRRYLPDGGLSTGSKPLTCAN